MTIDLTSACAKLARAREHRDALDAELSGINEGGRYRARAKFDSKVSAYLVTLDEIEAPDLVRLAAIIGDCAHNLRCTLDHIAEASVIANGGTPTRDTVFPVWETLNSKGNRRGPAKIRGGVNDAVLALVESLQPREYDKAGDDAHDHPLWIVDQLDTIDKHRHLNVLARVFARVQVALAKSDVALFIQMVKGTFKPGEVMAAFPFESDQGDMDVHGHFAVQVRLADFQGREVVGCLDDLIGFME